MVSICAKLSKTKQVNGFTLLELIVVIIILGVMSVGISSFITLSTQTYLNVSERDQLLGNARFVVERLNRELRNALPNSIKVNNNNAMQCLAFIPIEASTTYIDIPVAPEAAKQTISVIPFNDKSDNSYQCNACADQVIVYPLTTLDVYDDHNDLTGKMFTISALDDVLANQWEITMQGGEVLFDDDSPTERIFIVNKQISYCVSSAGITRYDNAIASALNLPPSLNGQLMAQYMAPFNSSQLPFTIVPATLQRNAIVQVNLHFFRDGEDYIFNNDIHIKNIP